MITLSVTILKSNLKLNYNLVSSQASQVTTIMYERKKWLRKCKGTDCDNFSLLEKKKRNALIGLKCPIGWCIVVSQLFYCSRTGGRKAGICNHFLALLHCPNLLCYTNNPILGFSLISKQSIKLIGLFHIKLSACRVGVGSQMTWRCLCQCQQRLEIDV